LDFIPLVSNIDDMVQQTTQSGLQGIAIALLGFQLIVADIALFPDSGSLLVIGGAVIGGLGVLHSFRPSG